MKVLLSLLGSAAISASAVGTTLVVKTEPTTTQKSEIKNQQNFDTTPEDMNLQIQNLRKEYLKLSDNEKNNIAQAMAELPKLNPDQISEYLMNSDIDFIKENQLAIETMYSLSTSMNQINYSLSTFSLNVDWNTVNQFLDLGFGDSNEYTPSTSVYGPENWWDAIWDWGWRLDLPEGAINIVRLIDLGFSLYNGTDFAPALKIVQQAKPLFDYLINIDDHKDDKMIVLYNMLVEAKSDFQSSGIPFAEGFYDIFDKALDLMKQWEALLPILPVSIAIPIIKEEIKNALGMELSEIGAQYSTYIDLTVNILEGVNQFLDILHAYLPGLGFIFDFIMDNLKSIAKEMVAADTNHQGVYIKFQQFIIPLDFNAR